MASPEPLLAALALFATDVVTALTSGRSSRSAARARARAARAAAALRRDAKRLQAPHTFAACAKLERRALALEKEDDRLAGVEAAVGGRGARVTTAVKLAVCLLLVFRFWGKPVAILPGAAGWPVSSWLASPHRARGVFAGGGVAVLPWLAAARAASGAAVRVLSSIVA